MREAATAHRRIGNSIRERRGLACPLGEVLIDTLFRKGLNIFRQGIFSRRMASCARLIQAIP